MLTRTDKKYHERMLELSNYAINFSGKDVLEVGGCESPELLQKYNPKSWTAIDISDRRLALLGKYNIPEFYHFKKMNIGNTSFNNNSFDYIYSLNCFEHISNLGAAFAEMYRILKPNGILFSKFGPIWSSPIGHHTWVEHNNRLFHFNDNLFDDWYHLAYSKEDFIKLLQNQYPDEILNKIAYSVYKTDDINRLVDSDYLNIIRESDFDIILIFKRKLGTRPKMEVKERITERYPQIKNLHTSSFLIILSKNRLLLIKKIKIYKRLIWYFIRNKI